MEELMIKITERQILTLHALPPISFSLESDEHCLGFDCIQYICREQGLTDTRGQDECLLACSVEDVKETERLNKSYDEIYSRAITFLPEVQEKVINTLNKYIADLKKMKAEMTEEKERDGRECEERRSKWRQIKIYKEIRPRGGENGQDGYIDAEYKSQLGEIARMVERDVFDVGCYSYPKRFEKTEKALNQESWTESEIEAAKWLSEFGRFKSIRM